MESIEVDDKYTATPGDQQSLNTAESADRSKQQKKGFRSSLRRTTHPKRRASEAEDAQARQKRNTQYKELEPDAQMSLNEFINSGAVPPARFRPKIYKSLNHTYINDILNEDYDNAIKVKRTINDLNQSIKADKLERQRERNFQEVEKKLEQEKAKLEKAEDQWDTKITNFSIESDKRLEALENKQAKEIEELDEYLADPATLRQFTKPSGRLLNLRKMEKNLVLVQEFDTAKKLRQDVDLLYEVEREQAEEKIKFFSDAKRTKLNEQHRRELLCFQVKEERLLSELKLEKERDLEVLGNYVEKLQKIIDEKEDAEIHGGKVVYFPKRMRSTLDRKDREYSAQTPQTAKRLINYKNPDHDGTLPIPLDYSQSKKSKSTKKSRRFSIK